MTMITVKLKQELDSLRNNELQNSELFLNEIKQLMEGTVLQEREILKEVGLGSNLLKAEEQARLTAEMRSAEKEYGENIYSIQQIKHLALKYNLRFLVSHRFKGTVAPELGAVLVRFKNKHLLTEYDFKTEFYILAPKEMFTLTSRPIDPLLFYRVRDKFGINDKYVLVHKWGNDFTFFRRLSGIINKNGVSIMFKRMLTNVAIFTSIFFALKLLNSMLGLNMWETHNYPPMGVAVVFNWVALAGVLIYNLSTMKTSSEYQNESSETNWNCNYE